MSGSILIHSGNKKKRDEKVAEILATLSEEYTKSHPDVLVVSKEGDKNTIGIGEVRKITAFLTTKPYSTANKVVVINSAHLLTPQAQNALLKTLEEPPTYGVIILEAKTEDSLLPTVVSRCKKIETTLDLKLLERNLTQTNFDKIKEMSVGEKLTYAEELSKKDQEEIVTFLEECILSQREELLEAPSVIAAENIELLTQIKDDIEDTNVNTRLALERLFIFLE